MAEALENQLLDEIYLFKDMSPGEMALIYALTEKMTVPAGKDIFSESDPATSLYIIQSGSIRIHQKSSIGDNIEVAVLGTGSHFGEMAFVDGADRSATATAIEDSAVTHIEYVKLQKTLSETPDVAVKFYRALSHFLCGRLRVTTNDLSFSRERNLRYF